MMLLRDQPALILSTLPINLEYPAQHCLESPIPPLFARLLLSQEPSLQTPQHADPPLHHPPPPSFQGFGNADKLRNERQQADLHTNIGRNVFDPAASASP